MEEVVLNCWMTETKTSHTVRLPAGKFAHLIQGHGGLTLQVKQDQV